MQPSIPYELNSKFSLKFNVATPFFTEAPISLVPEGIRFMQFGSPGKGPAIRALIASVSGESDFGRARTMIFLFTFPSESIVTKQRFVFLVEGTETGF